MAEASSQDQSLKRQTDAMTLQIQSLKDRSVTNASSSKDQLKTQIQTINDKKARMIDADKKQKATANLPAESTYPLDDIIVEATSDSNTFKHDGKEHALKIKDMKSSHGEFELHHDGSKWDLSNDSKKAYPHTAKAITATGFLNKVNKQWKTPSGNMSKDIQLGNVYHSHKDAEPINTHYGKDLKTNYIQVTGAGFYHTGNDEAKLGSPELAGKTDFRASMNKRKAKNGKYSASVIMALKDPKKSMHDLDAPLKEYTTMLPESRNNADALWDEAEEHLALANKHKNNKEAFHFHMSNHHDIKSQYHSDLGQHRQADVHADKAEEHHELGLQKHESLEEASRTETGELFKSLVDRAHTSSEDGNHSQAKRHLANAQTARYGITHQHMAKHKASFDKYKELKHSYTNSDDHIREDINICELSKSTLGTYTKKAAISLAVGGIQIGRDDSDSARKSGEKTVTKRIKGINRATDKLTKEEVELEEAHKIHDKVEIIKGSAKGTRGHIGEIRHGAFKGAPKQYTVYHGEHDATQVSKEHIRAIKESDEAWAASLEKKKEDRLIPNDKDKLDKVRAMLAKEKKPVKEAVDAMANLRQAHDRHMAKALSANKGGDDAAVKVHQVYMQKIQAKMQKLKRNEETIIESHLIHVSDGSKYGDEPSKKDVDHVMAGVKAHNGEHDGSSDKGAFFKFKSHSDAENFKRHVDKCPGKTCYADHTESTEFTAPSLDETWSKEQLANIKSLHAKMSKSVGLDPTKKYGTIITKSKKDREMDKAIKDEMNEISNATLTSYKQKAGEQASAADKAGDFKKGNKRFSGIVKATKKQFANDLKKEDLDESRGHKIIATFFKNREAWNKTPIKPKDDSIKKASTAKAMDQAIKDQIKEDGEGGVAANNAGSGNVAGFAGDAGKKVVMTKKPLQRKTLADFKKFVSQEHEEN